MMKIGPVEIPNIGTPFESWRDKDVVFAQTSIGPIKRALARQVAAAMAQDGLTRTQMARRMGTSRGTLDRLLNAEIESISLATLQKAAAAVGRKLYLDLE